MEFVSLLAALTPEERAAVNMLGNNSGDSPPARNPVRTG
jgi:hypothetical protein